mmetsp:Transcript_28929/g.74223  ORF Transcript_28929/g.74223 Transcript_28929/m.74223 type:complete len:251 (+) Transcript_28929:731-1483(+)
MLRAPPSSAAAASRGSHGSKARKPLDASASGNAHSIRASLTLLERSRLLAAAKLSNVTESPAQCIQVELRAPLSSGTRTPGHSALASGGIHMPRNACWSAWGWLALLMVKNWKKAPQSGKLAQVMPSGFEKRLAFCLHSMAAESASEELPASAQLMFSHMPRLGSTAGRAALTGAMLLSAVSCFRAPCCHEAVTAEAALQPGMRRGSAPDMPGGETIVRGAVKMVRGMRASFRHLSSDVSAPSTYSHLGC